MFDWLRVLAFLPRLLAQLRALTRAVERLADAQEQGVMLSAAGRQRGQGLLSFRRPRVGERADRDVEVYTQTDEEMALIEMLDSKLPPDAPLDAPIPSFADWAEEQGFPLDGQGRPLTRRATPGRGPAGPQGGDR